MANVGFVNNLVHICINILCTKYFTNTAIINSLPMVPLKNRRRRHIQQLKSTFVTFRFIIFCCAQKKLQLQQLIIEIPPS